MRSCGDTEAERLAQTGHTVPLRVYPRASSSMAEQRTFNPRVVGSSPTGPTASSPPEEVLSARSALVRFSSSPASFLDHLHRFIAIPVLVINRCHR